MIDFVCRSRWRACRFGWFSIFWIKSRKLAPCDSFTVECGTSGTLRVNVLLVYYRIELVVRVEWRNFTMFVRVHVVLSLCVLLSCWRSSGCPDPSEARSFSVRTFIIDLMGTGRLTFNNKHALRVIKLPWSFHRLALGLVGLVGRILLVWQFLLVTVEQLLLVAVEQLLNPILCPIVT